MNNPLKAPPAPDIARIQHFMAVVNETAVASIAHGHHPFAAILVAPDGETILLRQGNISTVEHAEAVLARLAAQSFRADYLWDCTLYCNVEPCAMCAGTAYWANIGTCVFGMTEARLLEITGSHPENPTMSLSAKTVFASGQKPVTLIGPLPECEEEIAAVHRAFWAAQKT